MTVVDLGADRGDVERGVLGREDLRERAATVSEAEQELENFARPWGGPYPTIVKQWRLTWSDLVALFDFPPAIRRAIYTTNAIESLRRVISERAARFVT